jgi:hypothetical protein
LAEPDRLCRRRVLLEQGGCAPKESNRSYAARWLASSRMCSMKENSVTLLAHGLSKCAAQTITDTLSEDGLFARALCLFVQDILQDAVPCGHDDARKPTVEMIGCRSLIDVPLITKRTGVGYTGQLFVSTIATRRSEVVAASLAANAVSKWLNRLRDHMFGWPVAVEFIHASYDRGFLPVELHSVKEGVPAAEYEDVIKRLAKVGWWKVNGGGKHKMKPPAKDASYFMLWSRGNATEHDSALTEAQRALSSVGLVAQTVEKVICSSSST